MTLPATAEVLVLGAGAIGSFAALSLARDGHDVTVLERKVPGIEASGTNAGSLGAQNKPVRLAALSLAAIEAWQSFDAETGLDTRYHRTGGFRVAETEEGAARLQDDARAQFAEGVPIEFISGDAARQRAPYLGSTVIAANYCAVDGHNDALIAAAQVARAASQAGARVICGVEALEIVRDRPAGTYTVITNRGAISASRLILTAGVWSRDFLVQAGIDLPVRLRNNQMMVTEPASSLLEHVIFHVDGHLTLKQVYPAASCLVGGGWPGDGDFRQHQKTTQLASTVGNAALAVRIVPDLAPLRVLRSWSGFDWRTTDQLPVVGEVPGWDGMAVCTSCFGGYTLSPLLGEAVAKAAITGNVTERFAEFTPAATMTRFGLAGVALERRSQDRHGAVAPRHATSSSR